MSGITLRLGDGFPKFRPELSAQVKELQELLRTWGYDITATGHFDWPTDSAVMHFQRVMGLTVDAQVRIGAGETWPALQRTPPAVPPGRSFSSASLETVPFIHQYDNIHVPGAGDSGCFSACETILRAVGVKQAGPANKFQIVTGESWKRDAPIQTIDATALKDGLAYLDGELKKSRPVMVGVSYSDEARVRGINEKITEHFAVIFEKADEGGEYTFHDPASKAVGASRMFSKDATTGNLTVAGIAGWEQYAVGARYYVTTIRKNEG